MRPIIERAWVFAVPIRIGGGTRLKILEAMSMEVAVVSTSVGAEGVPYCPNEHLLIADRAEEFAESLITLLNEATVRHRLAANAVEFVRENYDWTRIAAEIGPMLCGISS
jgi:glycosyltransferase involved in cell wall biosynthesis